MTEFHDIDAAYGYRQHLRPQTLSSAGRAGTITHVFLDLFLYIIRMRLTIPSLKIRDNPFKFLVSMNHRTGTAALVDILDLPSSGAVHQLFLKSLRQFFVRQTEIHPVIFR